MNFYDSHKTGDESKVFMPKVKTKLDKNEDFEDFEPNFEDFFRFSKGEVFKSSNPHFSLYHSLF